MSNYRLKNAAIVPPEGGFIYRQRETETDFYGAGLDDLVKQVATHREKNTLPGPDYATVQQEVENQICQRVGHEWCRNMNAQQWGFRLSWDNIAAGTKTLGAEAIRALLGSPKYCAPEEAERRARICVGCFANQRGGGCASCGFMDVVREVVGATCGEVRTSVDDRLNACQVCSCLLKCKVHYPADLLAATMTDQQRQAYADVDWCWMNKLE